jgi:succinate dehydrogenase/fumarate reductase flavoprotein subunit
MSCEHCADDAAHDFDLVVIGSGGAAFGAALRASDCPMSLRSMLHLSVLLAALYGGCAHAPEAGAEAGPAVLKVTGFT